MHHSSQVFVRKIQKWHATFWPHKIWQLNCRMWRKSPWVSRTPPHWVSCRPALSSSRDILFKMLSERDDISEYSKALISDIFLSGNTTEIVQLLLDCSVVPAIISAQDRTGNTLSEIFKFTRSWCFTIHQRRMKIAAAKQQDQWLYIIHYIYTNLWHENSLICKSLLIVW